MAEVPASRVTIRGGGDDCETPLRLTLEMPLDCELGEAVGVALEAWGRLGCSHPAVRKLVIVASVVEPTNPGKAST